MNDSNLISDTEIDKRNQRSKKSSGINKIYKQHYRKDWEKIPEFRDWISENKGNRERVYCKFCKKTLHAHKISLIKHTISLKHTKLAQLYLTNLNIEKEDSVNKNINSKMEDPTSEIINVECDDHVLSESSVAKPLGSDSTLTVAESENSDNFFLNVGETYLQKVRLRIL